MTNARQEFEEHVGDKHVVQAILYKNGRIYIFSDNMEIFLKKIDFRYDSGFGGQELFGVIWYADGTWSERSEYDGSEWWKHISIPKFESILKHFDELE